MMGRMAPPKKPRQPEIGPIGRNLMRAVNALRNRRGLTYKNLSELLEATGKPIFPLGLSRLERGARRVDVDELVALAAVLGVNPSTLLLPRDIGGDDLVELTPAVSHRAWIAWAWLDGETPLPAKDPGPFQAAEIEDSAIDWWRANARPPFVLSGRDPLVSEVETLLARVKMYARHSAAPGPLAANNARWWENHVRVQLERVKLAADESFAEPPPAVGLSGLGTLGVGRERGTDGRL